MFTSANMFIKILENTHFGPLFDQNLKKTQIVLIRPEIGVMGRAVVNSHDTFVIAASPIFVWRGRIGGQNGLKTPDLGIHGSKF